MSSKPVQRVCPLATILGSNVALPVARRLQLQLAEVALQSLLAFPVARVAPVVARRVVLLVAQMVGHLGFQRPLQDRFGQLLEQTVLPDDILGFLVVGEQLVDQLLVDGHGISILLFPWSFTQFYLHPHVSYWVPVIK